VLSKTKERISDSLSLVKDFMLGYFGKMKRFIYWGLRAAAEIARGGDSDEALIILLVIIAIVVGIPIALSLIFIAAVAVIVPILFYAGMIGVSIHAIRTLRGTDFVSLEDIRRKKIEERKKFEKKYAKGVVA